MRIGLAADKLNGVAADTIFLSPIYCSLPGVIVGLFYFEGVL